MKKHRLFILVSVAIVLLGLVIAEYYPVIKMLLKKQIVISEFIIRRPDGFQIIGDSTMLSLQEPLSIHFGQMKNGKDRLDDWKRFMEKKGATSRYETTKVGCKTGICLRTIKPDEKDPYEDIKIFVEPDLTIFISMPFNKQNQKREKFLQDFLRQNIKCSK
ncbi:MAG: hypothetical protein PHI97_28060 [Desulfobulbus sp.]|nr:hypothetical protein [Desulfobulbus sp.]